MSSEIAYKYLTKVGFNLSLALALLVAAGHRHARDYMDRVQVGQVTLIEGHNIRTGVTAILPHDGNQFQEKSLAAIYVGNSFVNPLVDKTNDGFLNDIRSRYISKDHILSAIHQATIGYVEEGNVGAGTGTVSK
ncbi:hypothetical protein I4U23_000205 [Adineta vaga]|nr:hypothetical protein I4U23_000205 [Adineta vaga]